MRHGNEMGKLDKDVVETRRWASSWKPHAHAIMMRAPGEVRGGHERKYGLRMELNTRPGHVTGTKRLSEFRTM